MNQKISVATACWGSYWDRFGSDFVQAMEQANPAEVVLVTDRHVSVPSTWIVKQPVSPVPMWDWFNEAVGHCSLDWVVLAGIDDLYFKDAFTNIDLQGDIVFIGLVHGGVSGCFPSISEWNDRVLRQDSSPGWMPIFCRQEVFLKYPWRRVIYSDWMQVVEFRYHGLKISIDPTPRFEHRVHDSNHSAAAWHVNLGYSQVRFMQGVLSSGLVLPGAEWPPNGCAGIEFPVLNRGMQQLIESRQKRRR